MKFMTTDDIRQRFIDFFVENEHTHVPTSSLVPQNDDTLLFTNAGMVQFKDVFLGMDKRSYTRATSFQRCVRAGGKHNDLEQVGYTKRHHTFFEMLGNFSFGDYFKREAIQFAWKFLTEELKIPVERLWVTVFHDDAETEKIWLNEMGVSEKRMSRCGEKDNFWSMGDTGPCGPCTEIFYDHGEGIAGGPPGSPDEDGDRYVEIWNLVFMQYNRNSAGELSPLPKPCVDTGMGLERIACVMQGVHDNYEIDLFKHLLANVSELTGCNDFSNKSMRAIADHIRSCAFLIIDGVLPSNEGRGYVLRRILRRAIRHGYKLGVNEVFFYKLVAGLVEIMGKTFPGLVSQQAFIEDCLRQEEVLFAQTLGKGMKILETQLSHLVGKTIPGTVAFLLYDTYGFPVDLTADIARERGLSLDTDGFHKAMERQRELSKSSNKFKLDEIKQLHISESTQFVGYNSISSQGVVKSLIGFDNRPVTQLAQGERGMIILDKTALYPEGGGQVGDAGLIVAENSVFVVEDSQKHAQAILHFGYVRSGEFKLGQTVETEVDESRQAIKCNHSATHLLHQALRQILGDHITQKGSLVAAKHLRFDFSHPQAIADNELEAIEIMINTAIRNNVELHTEVATLEEAQNAGAMALFGEKYAAKVRVVTMGNFSKEVCGGTHVNATGDIGCFKIVSESAVAQGVRRIEAITGRAAMDYVRLQIERLHTVSQTLKTNAEKVNERAFTLLTDNKSLQRQCAELKHTLAQLQGDGLLSQAKTVGKVKLLAVVLDNADRDSLRASLDRFKDSLGDAAVVLASIDADSGKVVLVAGVSKSIHNLFTAPELLKHVASQMNGKGGGRPDFAQGGADSAENLQAALNSTHSWVEGKL
jgi:alanyl-tRNA synthetase